MNRFASGLLAKGKAARTVQARLTAIKAFTKWLTEEGKHPADPLVGVRKPNPQADRRHQHQCY